jgi:hypothetical protein
MPTIMRPSPTFIVGVPRSGTTLLAAMMNAHGAISCGNETHFFERLTGAVAAHVTDSRHWPGRAINYMTSLHHMGNSLFNLYQIDLKDYSDRLRRTRPAVPAMLGCFMDARLAQTGKSRWVEKTPGHLTRFTMIRHFFPTSHVVCIFRDPRDVALSLLAVPWGTSKFLDGLIIWRSYYNYYKNRIEGDKWTCTIRYEDLVREPARTANGVCRFLGQEFDEGMLDTSRSAADVGGAIEPYKTKVSAPADAARAFAWTDALGDAEVALCDRLLRDALIGLGYPAPSPARTRDVSLYPFERRTETLALAD